MIVTSRGAALSLALGAFLLAGCSNPVPPPPEAQPTQTAAPLPRPPVSINAQMVAFVDHAGHALWEVEGEGKAPKTDGAWADIEHHATQLAASGTLVMLGGTGINDLVWIQSPGWQKWARAMSDAGLAAGKAARGKDLTALVAANGQLVDACEGCHKEFKPDLPSEGLTHEHLH